ncbi:16S rRNA (uracil(1498)-N(3))-methyltransferase [Erysipelotrichaceae bacterium RD49]|nr:16S rRNA (uracil(1498)-N(3))-methyltransferase [Erysipelotrichaceae bacterium RD49]
MKQIFVEEPIDVGKVLSLNEKTAHHLFHVTRTTPKEKIRVISRDRHIFYGHVQDHPHLLISEKSDETLPESPELTLCAALIKADKFEWMLQKAAELGVTKIVPFTSANTIISLEPKKIDKKIARWQSILEGACRQSNRTDLVTIEKPVSLADLVHFKSDLNLCAWEKENVSRHLCCALDKLACSATFVIGPEGGLSAKEADFLEQEGFELCSLGNRILRAETAACYVLACSDYAWNQNHGVCKTAAPSHQLANKE